MKLREHRYEAAWFAAALLSIVSVPVLAERFWILAFVPPAIVFLAGLVLVVYWWFSGAGRRALTLLSLIALVGLFAGQLQAATAIALTHIRFKLDRDVLDAIVDRERGNSPHAVRTNRGRYIVEPGAPLRIAFPAPGGITDNWCAVVFDASGGVMRANRFHSDFSNWDDPDLADVKALFGGDLMHCRQLDIDYFYCCFT